jgi:hypothetical protein
MFLLLPLLAVYPLFLVWLVRRRVEVCIEGDTMEGIRAAICLPYAEGLLSGCWEAMLMAQRLVLVLVSVFVQSGEWRQWILLVLLCAAAYLHVAVRPLSGRLPNNLMTVFMGSLTSLAAFSAMLSAFETFGNVAPPSVANGLEVVSSMLMALPLVVLGVVILLKSAKSPGGRRLRAVAATVVVTGARWVMLQWKRWRCGMGTGVLEDEGCVRPGARQVEMTAVSKKGDTAC